MLLKLLTVEKETRDILSLIFEKPAGFNFYPGQYLDIALPISKKRNDSRILSIASSPSEEFIMLTYKKGVSQFKKSLQNLKKGDLIFSSHPAGTVVIDDSSPIVMMAGGIGIAPHRSMLKWAVDRKLTLPITLIYSNSDENFIFKQELDSWQKQLSSLAIHYINTSKNGRLNEDLLKKLLPVAYRLLPIFYLAGPPAMVDDFEIVLLKLGVDSVNIRTDRFDGY